MADLNKMGTQYAQQYSTVITTNSPNLGITPMLLNSSAVARRFVRVSVTVRPECQVPGEPRLDPSRLEKLGLDDALWDGVVETAQIVSSTEYRWVQCAKFSSARELFNVLKPMAERKFSTSKAMSENYPDLVNALSTLGEPLPEQVVITAAEEDPWLPEVRRATPSVLAVACLLGLSFALQPGLVQAVLLVAYFQLAWFVWRVEHGQPTESDRQFLRSSANVVTLTQMVPLGVGDRLVQA